jgi:hypothetical protein
LKSRERLLQLGNLFRRKIPAPADKHTSPVDLRSPDFFSNPYSIYSELRASQAIAPCNPAGFILTRHQDVKAALTNPNLGNAPSRYSTLHRKNADKYVAANLAQNILPFMEGDAHISQRRIVSKVFLDHLKASPGEMRDVAGHYCQAMADRESADLIADFAECFAIDVMCRFIGFPQQQRAIVKRFSSAFFFLFAPIGDPSKFAEINDTLAQFRVLVGQQLATRRRSPEDDLLTRFLDARVNNCRLNEQEIIDTCILLFADGVENVLAGIVNVMLGLSQASHIQADFKRGELRVRAIVEEGLRLDTPAQIIPRIVKQDTEICGTALKQNTPVFLALGSANRDESVFVDADAFNPNRSQENTLTFGGGRHSCIGAQLAKKLIEIAVEVALVNGVKVTSRPAEISYQHRFGHRWAERLDVTI